MKNRFVVVVIDSFGVGAMDDCAKVRPQDLNSNTALHILQNENLHLPTLERLGLMNAIGEETENMKKSSHAAFATANLKHYGADTFFGHQELMGTRPFKPTNQRFGDYIDPVTTALQKAGHKVDTFQLNGNKMLVVDDAMVVGDNMETDLGQAINVSGTFSLTTFENVKKVGKIVRSVFRVPRIIALGGEDVSLTQILDSAFEKDGFIGLDTPKSGVYNKGYEVVHLGYGVDESVQLPKRLKNQNINTFLYGKVADIVENPHGNNIFGVDTKTLFESLIEDLKKEEEGFFCLNVQETDLAGHRCESGKYANVLQITDEMLDEVLKVFGSSDQLIVMADHGNDPYSGRSQHTREKVPVLIKSPQVNSAFLGERKTLADVGQTVASHFGTKLDFGEKIF